MCIRDRVYPAMMELLPAGLFGLTVAALIAAIVSSLSSMINSISTIFTMDIYRSLRPEIDHNDHSLVNVGRLTSLSALILAVMVSRPKVGVGVKAVVEGLDML